MNRNATTSILVRSETDQGLVGLVVGLCSAVWLLVAALSVHAQSNPIQKDSATAGATTTAVQHAQQIRTTCIEGRRLICGRILEVLPEGLIVECGYTNLLREAVSRSWLIPGTVTARRAENLIESKMPGAFCV